MLLTKEETSISTIVYHKLTDGMVYYCTTIATRTSDTKRVWLRRCYIEQKDYHRSPNHSVWSVIEFFLLSYYLNIKKGLLNQSLPISWRRSPWAVFVMLQYRTITLWDVGLTTPSTSLRTISQLEQLGVNCWIYQLKWEDYWDPCSSARNWRHPWEYERRNQLHYLNNALYTNLDVTSARLVMSGSLLGTYISVLKSSTLSMLGWCMVLIQTVYV